jgi:hypothetical protein
MARGLALSGKVVPSRPVLAALGVGMEVESDGAAVLVEGRAISGESPMDPGSQVPILETAKY